MAFPNVWTPLLNPTGSVRNIRDDTTKWDHRSNRDKLSGGAQKIGNATTKYSLPHSHACSIFSPPFALHWEYSASASPHIDLATDRCTRPPIPYTVKHAPPSQHRLDLIHKKGLSHFRGGKKMIFLHNNKIKIFDSGVVSLVKKNPTSWSAPQSKYVWGNGA
jgi:hypothetical protein